MNDITKRTIEKRVEIILREFSFKTRQERDAMECACYSNNKPCHNIPADKLNCFFCLCPEYDNSKKEGGCRIENPEGKGKWFYHPAHANGRIWDCSECTYPHKKENIRKYLNKLFSVNS